MTSVPIPVEIGGALVYIEMEPVQRFGEENTTSGAVEQISRSFDRAKQTIVRISGEMVQAIRAVDPVLTPNEFTLEFGVKFRMDGTVVVAAVSSEATLTVKLVYHHKA